jgi:hypothetical protein
MRTKTDWFDNDELFRREVANGHHWEREAARQLCEIGIPVEVAEQRVRKSVQERHLYVDSKDLLIVRGALRGHHIEVKSRNERFTCPETFPYNTVIVDTKSGWDAKAEKPIAYLDISTITRCMIWTPGDRCEPWSVHRRWDRVRGIWETNYEADRKLWKTIDSLLWVFQQSGGI